MVVGIAAACFLYGGVRRPVVSRRPMPASPPPANRQPAVVPRPPSVASQPATQPTDAADLKGTIVTAVLDQPMLKGTNVLWCGTFQLAWNELMDYAGGPVQVSPAAVLCDSLNRREFSGTDIDPACYMAVAGLVGEGVVTRAKLLLQQRFPTHASRLLPEVEHWPDGWIAYAFLARELLFQYPFGRTPGGLHFSYLPLEDGQVQSRPLPWRNAPCFGIGHYDPSQPVQSQRASQVKILLHESGDPARGRAGPQFVVELLTTQKDDRLILALVPPGKTLGATVDDVLQRMGHPNTVAWQPVAGQADTAPDNPSCLMELESFQVPLLDFDIRQEFQELIRRSLVSSDSRINGYPIEVAKQIIRFGLNETGATLVSEALVGGRGEGPPRAPRDLSFNRPFLVLLLHKGAAKPYFALWVGNTELLQVLPLSGKT